MGDDSCTLCIDHIKSFDMSVASLLLTTAALPGILLIGVPLPEP